MQTRDTDEDAGERGVRAEDMKDRTEGQEEEENENKKAEVSPLEWRENSNIAVAHS